MTVDTIQQLKLQEQALKNITVDEFFGQINWSGIQRLPLDNAESHADATYETVGQFFSTFPWQGQSDLVSDVLATDMEEDYLEQFIEGEDALTLDDLSALF
ncbi:MAG: hypothetical protein AAFY17_07435 [Cyanobacteria bacterium J06642_11]